MSFALQLRTGRYLSNQLHKYIQSVSRNADLYVRNLFFISRHALDDMPGVPVFYVGFKTTTQHRDKIYPPSPDFALNMDFAIIICYPAAGNVCTCHRCTLHLKSSVTHCSNNGSLSH